MGPGKGVNANRFAKVWRRVGEASLDLDYVMLDYAL